jgi:hypothetical protein
MTYEDGRTVVLEGRACVEWEKFYNEAVSLYFAVMQAQKANVEDEQVSFDEGHLLSSDEEVIIQTLKQAIETKE